MRRRQQHQRLFFNTKKNFFKRNRSIQARHFAAWMLIQCGRAGESPIAASPANARLDLLEERLDLSANGRVQRWDDIMNLLDWVTDFFFERPG